MARRTVELAGVRIPAGTSVMLMVGAVNRDPRVFDDPDQLRLGRPNHYEHIAFSRGAHTCLGQQLARTEMRVSLERIFERTTDIGIDEAQHGPRHARRYRYEPTSLFRGLTSLHLTFTPA
jgi:cytochrome P450